MKRNVVLDMILPIIFIIKSIPLSCLIGIIFIVCIIFAQLSKGKSVGYLNDLYNDLRTRTIHIVYNTVSLSYIFRIQFAIRWMVKQSCNERFCNNWLLCKYLFAKYFAFFSFSLQNHMSRC